MSMVADFVHVHTPPAAGSGRTLLLLHGTGGDERDLLGLGRELSPKAGLLSPRGQVLENGMPRFFRRLAMGVFDEPDLRRRTADLAAFLGGARRQYGIGELVAVGYSNGANIAASLLLLEPDALDGAVLFRAMVPLVPETLPQLNGKPVLLCAAGQDPYSPEPERQRLVDLLTRAGAEVAVNVVPGGHGLTPGDVDVARRWLASRP